LALKTELKLDRVPTSFYIFLVASLIALIPAWFDHGETWAEIKSGEKEKRCANVIKLMALWIIPFLTIIGTLYLGLESIESDDNEKIRDQVVVGLSNQLSVTTLQLNVQSNQVRQVASKYNAATNALAVAQSAVVEAANTESNNLVLQEELQPRTIRMEQITNFIFLTMQMPKFPIRIAVGSENEETFSYAVQIRSMFNEAGYGIPDSDINFPEGIHSDQTAITYFKRIGNSNQIRTRSFREQSTDWPDVEFITDNTNFWNLNFPYGPIGGNGRPIITGNTIDDTNETYAAFPFVFRQIGINYIQGNKPEWVKPDHFEVFILQKLK
jgi:hypothetical protein